MNDNYWFGLAVNFKWPHEGFGLSYDLIPEDEQCPWFSTHLRLGFITLMIDVGYGEENKRLYNGE